VFEAAVSQLAASAPIVLIVEDLHWADDATLDVLGYLARRIDDLPALLVFTYRDAEVPGLNAKSTYCATRRRTDQRGDRAPAGAVRAHGGQSRRPILTKLGVIPPRGGRRGS
jgi:hypothetical protein